MSCISHSVYYFLIFYLHSLLKCNNRSNFVNMHFNFTAGAPESSTLPSIPSAESTFHDAQRLRLLRDAVNVEEVFIFLTFQITLISILKIDFDFENVKGS